MISQTNTSAEVRTEVLREEGEPAALRRTRCHPSTARTRQLREAFMEQRPSICGERSVLVTESYRQTEALPPVLRQALAFEKVLRDMPLWIEDGELIVGNIASRPRGIFLFPEYDATWIEREYDTISTRTGDPWQLSADDTALLKSCADYWPGRNFAAIADAVTPDEVKRGEQHTYISVAMGKQGGIGHLAPDIEGVITRGLNAYIQQAEDHIQRLDLTKPEDAAKLHFLQAVIITDRAVIQWAQRFAQLAREQARATADLARRAELEEIAAICEWVPAHPARTFREALQVVAFIMDSVQIESNGVSIGTGRLDQYCFPYYEADVREDRLTRAQAVELLECLWFKLADSNRVSPAQMTMNHLGYPFWVQVPIGGQTADGYDATNDLSYLVLEATTNVQLHEPTVSARIHKRTPDKFLLKCGEAVRSHGGGLPALFNDEVIIPSQFLNVPGISKEDAYDYSVIGCSEVAFGGRGTEGFAYQGMNSGRLLETLMAGTDPTTGKPLPSAVGGMLEWKTAGDMWQAFREQVRRYTRFMFMQVLPLVDAHNTHRPCPYLSSVTRDCIERGQNYYGGGARYGNGVVNVCIVGIGTLGNSLAAIKKLVFDDRVLTAAQLQHALETNFADDTTTPTGAAIQRLCAGAPKYGNDDPYVDYLTKDCLNILVKELRQYKTQTGGGYQATISPVSTHVIYGMMCGATPDGRKAGTPLSEGCSPAQGTDVNGPTATVKSVAALEHINLAQGTIFNMKFHPAALGNKAGLMKWANLVRTYFDLGGWEIQFNVVDVATLRAAQEHPEQYKDLVVRVVGYSAFFVDLDKSVQDDIIARTEHVV
ncbi:MAG: putative pyruvate formate-lyase [Deltaproteobacteria bacterium]|nr:putative pyruvate formate-lyase [Deltaproteobacteria bacterium]